MFHGRREYGVPWPRDVAARFLRAMAEGPDAVQVGGPLTEAEARAVLTTLTKPENTAREHLVESALFLIEAFFGSEWTLETVLSLYEGMSQAALNERNPHGIVHVAWWSGFLLKRVPDAVAAKARARLEKLIAAGPLNPVTTRLSFVVGGERALEASGHKITPFNMLYCTDPQFMATNAAYKGYVVLDPYFAWLGGDAVLRTYVELAKKADRESVPASIEGLARLASPIAVEVLEVLGQKKYLAEQVAAALATRRRRTARGAREAASEGVRPDGPGTTEAEGRARADLRGRPATREPTKADLNESRDEAGSCRQETVRSRAPLPAEAEGASPERLGS